MPCEMSAEVYGRMILCTNTHLDGANRLVWRQSLNDAGDSLDDFHLFLRLKSSVSQRRPSELSLFTPRSPILS
jgi:hypothetical protein